MGIRISLCSIPVICSGSIELKNPAVWTFACFNRLTASWARSRTRKHLPHGWQSYERPLNLMGCSSPLLSHPPRLSLTQVLDVIPLGVQIHEGRHYFWPLQVVFSLNAILNFTKASNSLVFFGALWNISMHKFNAPRARLYVICFMGL